MRVVIGGLYVHGKSGAVYEVMGILHHHENKDAEQNPEIWVRYRKLGEMIEYCRDEESFLEPVRWPGGLTQSRYLFKLAVKGDD